MSALGVLVVSGEYSSGSIRATLAAVPRRLPVLVAKTVVLAVVVGATMVAASVVAFLVAQAVLSGHRPTFSLGDEEDVLRLVFPSWGDYIAAYLPTGAGASFSTTLGSYLPHALGPWVGLGVMVAWVVLGMVAAVAVLLRRDA